MVRRITVVDLVAVAAVLLLLVGTPSYIAAGPVARSIPSDGTVEITALHVGDQASFTLLVTEPDGTSQRSDGFLELTVERALDPDPSRDGFALQWTQNAANATVGRVAYATETATASYRWSDDGVPGMGEVVTENRPTTVPTGNNLPIGRQADFVPDRHRTNERDAAATFDGTPWRHTYQMLAPRGAEALQPLPYTQVQYRPSDLDAIFRTLEEAGVRPFDDSPENQGETPVRSFLAAEYEQRLLLAVTPRAYTSEDPVVATVNGMRIYGSPPSHIVLDHPLPTNIVRADPPLLWDHAIAWDWVTPELGAVAGFHQELLDQDGAVLLTIDLVPSTITRGNGQTAAPPPETKPLVTPPTEPEAWTTLGALHTDTRPLHQNLSLADIADHLHSEAAPGTVRSFMERDAYFAGYAYEPGTTTNSVRRLTDLLPVDTGPSRVSTGTWHVTLLQDDGMVRVAELEIQEAHETGDHVVSVTDACGASRRAFFTSDCTPLEVTPALARDRAIADPLTLRGAFVEGHADHDHEHAHVVEFYLPLYRLNESGFASDPMSPYPSFWDGMATGGVGWHAMAPQGGLMNFHYGTNRERYDLGTSARLLSHERVEADDATPLSPMAGQSAAAPRVVTEADARLILAGVILFAAALATRLVLSVWVHLLWLATGGLFHRIPQDKVLNNTHRQGALQAITDDPGMSLSEVSARLDLPWSTTVHHLRTLQRAGLVTSLAEGRNRHFFATGTLSPAEMLLSLVHRKPVYRDLLTLVSSRPGIALSEAAKLLERDVSGTSRTGTRLARLDVLTKRRIEGKVCFYPASSGESELQAASATEGKQDVRSLSP